MISTILKWAGNKAAIMPDLLQHLPAGGQRLVEPFAGSCAVMMATDYPAYLVADINPDLINLYRTIANDCDAFIELAQIVFESYPTSDDYYHIRHAFNQDTALPLSTRAAYFLYLNRHCYRGLCRYNGSGGFNVPYGNYRAPYFPEAEIHAFADKATRATFICAGFEETLSMVQTGDVVYCDPPYDGVFTAYHTKGFSEDDQYCLASVLTRLAAEGFPVVASNANTMLVSSLYRAFILHRISASRGIGVAAGDGKKATEVIAVSNSKPYASWIGFDPANGCEKCVELHP